MSEHITNWILTKGKELLWFIGSIFAIVLTIIKIRETIIVKKPNLKIEEVKIKPFHGADNKEYLDVHFKLANKKTWWNKLRITDASNPHIIGAIINKDGKIEDNREFEPEIMILYSDNYIEHEFRFPYTKECEELIITLDCEEASIKEVIKIKE